MKIPLPQPVAPVTHSQRKPTGDGRHDETDMTEMFNALRVLITGAQLLAGFLITLPFNAGFRQIVQLEKRIVVAAFLCSLGSLIFFATPAVRFRSSQ